MQEQLSIFDLTLHTQTPEETPHESTPVCTPISHTPINPARVPDDEYKRFKPVKAPRVDDIIKTLEKGIYKVGAHELLSDVFECGAIAISNRFDKRQAEEREKRYLQIMNKHDKKVQQLIVEIFSQIYALLSNMINPHIGFGDYLGELYMRSETSNKHAGQFFTPYNLSKLTAAISVDAQVVRDCMEADGILSINEPACGSAGMIVAALDVLYNRERFNIGRNLFIECSDIDSRCVHMAYLQLALAGVPAVVYRRDTLTMTTWEMWETPALIMQWPRFKRWDNRKA